jgi:hypothetical protein
MTTVLLVLSFIVPGQPVHSVRHPVETVEQCLSLAAKALAKPPAIEGAHAVSAACMLVTQGAAI